MAAEAGAHGPRARLEAGEVLVGPLVSSSSPPVVELFGHVGFDFVLIDTEQSGTSPFGTGLDHLIRAAEASGVPPMVRVADNSEAQINKALNAGARGVWVPHVETAAEASRAVAAVHYSPLGHRGAAPIVRAARYGLDTWADYRARSAADSLLVAIVESVKGIDHVEEIAAVEGLHAICFGPFDSAVDAGLRPEEFYGDGHEDLSHPFLEKSGARVLAACRAHGKIAATAAWNAAAGRRGLESGYRLLLYGLDLALIGRAARALRAEVTGMIDEIEQ